MSTATRGIVVLPAIAGVNAYIAGVVHRLEAASWQAEVVDYFEGSAPPDLTSMPKILEAVASVDDTRVLGQTADAVSRLRARGVSAIGTLGFCIGGGYALLAGASVEGLCGAVNYYGGLRQATSPCKPVSPLDQVALLRMPLLSHYGGVDRFVPPADVDALEAALDATGKTFELYRYAGAPHAFDEDLRPSYRPVAAREAWARTLTFLDWYVREA